jgi:hypothetical protein
VVDEEAAAESGTRRLLEVAGFRVSLTTVAAIEPAAVALMAPDLVLLNFPVGAKTPAWDRLHLLKREPATAGLPVVLGTPAGSSPHPLEADLLGLGAWPLPMPCEDKILLEAVAQALAGRPQPPRAARREALRRMAACVRLARRRGLGLPPAISVPHARLRTCRIEHAAGDEIEVLARLEEVAIHRATLVPFALRLRDRGGGGELRLVEEESGRVVARITTDRLGG